MTHARSIPALVLGLLIVVGPLTAMILADPPRNAGTDSSQKATRAKATPAKAASPGVRKSDKSTATTNTRKTGTKSAALQPAPISKSREKAAVRFAHQHHPELAELLECLRRSDTRNFQAGLRALTRDSERLAKLAERDDERYSVSLELWKLDSRLRLEVARLSMSPGEDFEPRLRPLMEQQQAARIKLIGLERKRLADRLTKYDEQLRRLNGSPNELITLEIERLQKLVAFRARSKGARPASAKNSTKATAKPSLLRTKTADARNQKVKTTRTKKTPTTSVD